jgi:hypothetical protein
MKDESSISVGYPAAIMPGDTLVCAGHYAIVGEDGKPTEWAPLAKPEAKLDRRSDGTWFWWDCVCLEEDPHGPFPSREAALLALAAAGFEVAS